MPKNLKIEDIVAIQDSREQCPVDLSPLKTIVKGLKVGDYSVEGYEDKIAIERKSLQDFIGCCGSSRERFERNIERLQLVPFRAIVIEGNWSTIELKQYRGTIHPNAILGSALGWALGNISILMADTPARAGKIIARMLWIAANRIHRATQQSDTSSSSHPQPDHLDE